MLHRISRSLDVLRRGFDDMPMNWVRVMLRVAERPGCTVTWLVEDLGLAASVVHRILQELGPERARDSDATGLVNSVADPINAKRKIYLLTDKGRARIEEMLSTAYASEIAYRDVTVERYLSEIEDAQNTSRVQTDYFGQSQLTSIRTAARRRFKNFVGDNLVTFPLEPAKALIGPQRGADGERYDGLSGWVTSHRGRWFEMPSIYPMDGGVALADFDDPNDAFHFVLEWRGGHKQSERR